MIVVTINWRPKYLSGSGFSLISLAETLAGKLIEIRDSEEESRDHDEAKSQDNHVVVFPALP